MDEQLKLSAALSSDLQDCQRENAKLRREVRDLKKTLREHAEVCRKVIAALDIEMKKPSDMERGKRIAKIVGALEFTNDRARYFQLGEAFPLKR